MSDTVSILSLFISSFLAATLLPGGSEAALFAVLKAYPETLWHALFIASIGNTLGGMVTFGMGWLLPLRRGGSEAAGLHQDHLQGEHLVYPLAGAGPATQARREIAQLRRTGTAAGMGAIDRRCAVPDCRLAAAQSVASCTVHGDRQVRALRFDCACHVIAIEQVTR